MKLSRAMVRTSAGVLVASTGLVLSAIHVVTGSAHTAPPVAAAGITVGWALARVPMRFLTPLVVVGVGAGAAHVNPLLAAAIVVSGTA